MMIIRMQIAAVDVELIPLPAVTPALRVATGSSRVAPARTTAVLRITTEDGAIGEAYHEWSGPMLGDIVDRILREELVGERADRREWLWHRLWELDRTEEFPIWVFGVVDVALWDLEGRVFGVRSTVCSAPIGTRFRRPHRRRPSPLSRSSSTFATSV